MQTQEMQQEILQRLDAVALKMGVAAEHLWEVLVRQAYLQWIPVGLLLVFLLPITTFLIVFREEFDDDASIGPMIFLTIIAVALSIALLLMASTAISATLNPEYWALNKLLSLF